MFIDLYSQLPGQIPVALRCMQPHRKDHQIELLIPDLGPISTVPEDHILRLGPLTHYSGLGPYVADAGHILGPLVESLESFAVGADIVVKDDRLHLGMVLFREDYLFRRVHAAYGGAVSTARGFVP